MSPKAAFWRWFALGAITSALLLFAQSSAVGGVAGLLQVGETSSLRPIIEEQLGEISLASGPGHDGQIYYGIGLDLRGRTVPELLDHGAYRYRRILYSLTASVGGILDGWGLLYGMIVVTVASTAVAAGSVAAMAARNGRSDWFALAVLLNPGVWLSVRLLTGDMLALSMMAVGLFWFTKRRKSSIAAFALSALSKDIYLTTPAGLAISQDRRRWSFFLVPLLVMILWMSWLTFTMAEGFTGRGNLTIPFVGIVDGAANWANLDAEEWIYLIFALVSVAAGLVTAVFRASWLRWSILGWALLGILSSNWVWDFGNNAARAFAPIAVLLALSYLPRGIDVGTAFRDDAAWTA